MRRAWLVVPAVASAVGASVASRADVSPLTFLPNAVGIVLGGLLALAVSRAGSARLSREARAWGFVACVLLAATLAGPETDGVHRWVRIGPFSLHVSSALGPWLVFAFVRARPLASLALLAASQIFHVLQPDAAQAGALAAASIACAATSTAIPRRMRIAMAAIGVAGLVLAILRRDSVAPVAHVEGIFVMARNAGPAFAFAVLASVMCFLAPLVAAAVRAFTARDSAAPLLASLFGYSVATFLANAFGAFPFPLVGAGAGPVVGAMTTLALARVAQAPPDVDGDRRARR